MSITGSEVKYLSFLFARKTNNYLYILADTKINYSEISDQLLNKIGDTANLINKYGIIKNVIINRNLCVGAAGIVEHFNELLAYIENRGSSTLSEIVNKALDINNKYNQDTDFIIAFADNKNKGLYLVKDGTLNDVDSCWIGVKDCFRAFQSMRLDENIKDVYYDNDLSEEDNMFCFDKFCFSNVLNKNIDTDSVGKNMVNCYYGKDGFTYSNEYFFETFKRQTLLPGEGVIFGNSIEYGDGIIVSNFVNGCYAICYPQLHKSIIYEPYLDIEGFDRIRIPRLIDCGDTCEFGKENYDMMKKE